MCVKRKSFLFCIIALVLVVCTFFFGVQPTIAFAYERETNFDNTDVLEDLTSSTINGEPFDIKYFRVCFNLVVREGTCTDGSKNTHKQENRS